MPRSDRVVWEGVPHHVTQRGNYKQNIFNDDQDKFKYLFWIREYTKEYGVSILAYCLMPNHVHFIAVPTDQWSLANAFKITHIRYAQYFNQKNELSGRLWQGRFYSCVLDQPHFLCALRYVESNPVRSGLVHHPWDWKWSSALTHLGDDTDYLGVNEVFKFLDFQQYGWKEFLLSACKEEDLENIRKSTISGRPLGSDCFTSKAETRLGRRAITRK